jgi:hypothetical protein
MHAKRLGQRLASLQTWSFSPLPYCTRYHAAYASGFSIQSSSCLRLDNFAYYPRRAAAGHPHIKLERYRYTDTTAQHQKAAIRLSASHDHKILPVTPLREQRACPPVSANFG